MTDERDTLLLSTLALILLLPVSMGLYAYGAELNWNWFATTLGAPRIGFVQAYGLSMVLSAFRPHSAPARRDGETLASYLTGAFARSVTNFLFIVVMGWIVHEAMVSG